MSHHLSEETLLDYAHGRLNDDQQRAVEAHFDTCKTCLAFVEEHLALQIAFTNLRTVDKVFSDRLQRRLDFLTPAYLEELEQALSYSLELERELTETLEQTRQDLSNVDWKDTVPALIKKALAHVATRLTKEHTMREGLEKYNMIEAAEPQLQVLKDRLEENFEVHTRLHGLLLGARDVFFKEQERQSFKPRS